MKRKKIGIHILGIETMLACACAFVHFHMKEREDPDKQIILQYKNVELKREMLMLIENLVFNKSSPGKKCSQ